MSKHRDDLPPELDRLGERLRDERPAMDALAYDRGQQRVRRMAARPRGRSRRSSLAVALCLGVGALLSSGGAGLAVSGLASTDATSVQAQYPTVPGTTTATTPTNGYTTTTPTATTTVPTTPTTETIGAVPTTPSAGGGGGAGPSVAGVSASGGKSPTSPTSPTQAAAQVGATQGAGSLPFTGFAAIPVMLAGLALLVAGIALRRRRAPEH